MAFLPQELGFQVRTESQTGRFRWLPVGPKEQPDIDNVLLPPNPGPMLDSTAAKQLKELVAKGAICPGVFQTDDVRGDYEEMKKRGVVFKSPPTERHYGIEAVFQDDSGNWFSLTQRKK